MYAINVIVIEDDEAIALNVRDSLSGNGVSAVISSPNEAIEKTDLLLGLSPFPIYFEDAEGCCVFCNAEFARILGKKKDEMIGKFIDELHPKSPSEINKDSQMRSAKEPQLDFVTTFGRHVQAILKRYPVYGQDGHIKGQICSILDIKDLAQFEESLRKSECLFSSFFRTSPYGFAMTDDNGYIIECNHMMEQYTGREMPEILGRPIWDVYSMVAFKEDDLDSLLSTRAEIRDLFEKGDDLRADVVREISIEDESGRGKLIQVSMFPIKTNNGFMLGVISKDITSVKEADVALKSSARSLASSSMRDGPDLLEIIAQAEGSSLAEDGPIKSYSYDALGSEAKLPDGIFQRSLSNLAKSRPSLPTNLSKVPSKGSLDKHILEILKDRCNKDLSLSLVYDVLSISIDPDKIAFKKFVSNLIKGIAKSNEIEPSRISFRLEMDEAMLRLESAMSCGLIITELISRFIKHVFPEGQHGEICIEFRSLGASIHKMVISDNCINCRDESNGEIAIVPLLQVLSPLLKEIDGYIKIEETSGSRVTICFNELKYDNRLKSPKTELRKAKRGSDCESS